MSILSVLANIGITIGKAVMSIFGGKSLVASDGTEYQVGLCRITDITFVMRSKNEKRDIYICNTSPTLNYMVTFPNEEGENGDVIVLRYLTEHPITDWFSDKFSPEKYIYISVLEDTEKIRSDAGDIPMINLSFNRLQINGAPVRLGGFSISIMEQSGKKGIKVECEHAMGLQTLKACTLFTDKGMSLYSTDTILPAEKTLADIEETRFYPLDYTQHGLNSGDYVSGIINIEVNNLAVLTSNCLQSYKILPENVRQLCCNV